LCDEDQRKKALSTQHFPRLEHCLVDNYEGERLGRIKRTRKRTGKRRKKRRKKRKWSRKRRKRRKRRKKRREKRSMHWTLEHYR
jgi:hypothetical protein